jgi:hypothetical protein
MAILKNIEGRWFKLSPNRPAPAFGDSGPKWEFQAIARTKEQMQEWKDLGINVKPVEEDGKIVYKARFQRPTHKRPKDGKPAEPNEPVEVVSGQLTPLDPQLIGNGSIVNIVIFQYDYEVKSKDGRSSKKGKGTMLKKVQVKKLVRYEGTPEEDFEEEDFEEVEVAEKAESTATSGSGDASSEDADF